MYLHAPNKEVGVRVAAVWKIEVSPYGPRDAAANWEGRVCQGFDGRSSKFVFVLI